MIHDSKPDEFNPRLVCELCGQLEAGILPPHYPIWHGNQLKISCADKYLILFMHFVLTVIWSAIVTPKTRRSTASIFARSGNRLHEHRRRMPNDV